MTTAERGKLSRLRKLKEEREILSAAGLVRTGERDLETLFGFVKVNQTTHSVGVICRLLQIFEKRFYAWLERPMRERARSDLASTGKIATIYRSSKEVYEAPNIHAELADDHGIRVGRKRVARLMRAAGLRGATLRRYVVTTQVDSGARAARQKTDCVWSSPTTTYKDCLRSRIARCAPRMRLRRFLIFDMGSDTLRALSHNSGVSEMPK